MARVSGRSLWVAWPAGVLCAAVIAALLWLAAPGVPGAVDMIGTMLRGASATPSADGAGDAATDAAPATDCRDLYPDPLWAELTWTPDVLLSQNTDPPATASALATALTPAVRFTCTWRTGDGRSVSTTVATVPVDTAPVAHAALAAEGFDCTLEDGAARCERARGTVREVHDLRGDVWLSSVLDDWAPEDYSTQVASRVFPAQPDGT